MEEKVERAARIMIIEVGKAASYDDMKDLYGKVVPPVEAFRTTCE
jgi:hypothetical protein